MKKISLREKKFAKTKLNITFNVIEKLLNTSFENVSIKQVCEDVEISEATFYNYFPKKTDIIDYYTSLRLYKHFWCLKQITKEDDSPLDKIRNFFHVWAENIQIPVFNEVFTFYYKNKQYDHMKTQISVSEKIIAFPECEGIESIKTKNTVNFFAEQIEEAKQKKILDPKTDTKKLVLILHIIMHGSAIFSQNDENNSLQDYYDTQLKSTFESIILK